jgi:hypothetical protein
MDGLILVSLVWLAIVLLLQGAYRRGHLRTPWHLDVAALGLLSLATLGFFWRVASGQNWMPADGGDLVSFLFPSYRFAAVTLHDGAWPLWNPHLYGGAPHVGDIQAGFLYPPNLLIFLLRPDFPYATLQWLSMAHLWFAGAGMYLFLARGLRLGRLPALAGAVAFMFCDAFLVHFGNLNYNAVAAWLPWVFWPYTRALEAAPGRGRWLPALAAGALLGVATLAGHIQATLLIAMVLGFTTLLWLLLARDDPGPRARFAHAALCLLASFGVAFLLAAPVLLPAIQTAGLTERAGWNYQQAAGYSISPAQWIGWLVPSFFGRSPQLYWGIWPRVETGYIGILTLVLAAAAVALRRDRRTWLYAGLGAAAFVLALGIYAIVHGWLTLLPGFGWLRAPGRFVLISDFALAVLAAIGLDAALGPLEGAARAAFDRLHRWAGYAVGAVFAVAVPLAYLAVLLTQGDDPAATRTALALMGVMAFAGLLLASFLWLTARRGDWGAPVTLGWLAVVLIYLDLAGLGAYQDVGNTDPSTTFDQAAIVAFLDAQPGPFRIDSRTAIQDLWQPDTALLYGLEDVDGVANPSALADPARYWEGIGSRSSRLYDLLNARYVIARKDAPLDWDKFALAFDGDPDLNVYENRLALPRAFFVERVLPAASHEAAWDAIHAPDFDPATTAVVEGQPPAGGSGAVTEIIAQGPNRLAVRVSADGPAFLVLSQIWHPGWQAYVDGAPAGAPLRTDYTFQGVSVPSGEHTVELHFEPAPWRIGWLLAALGGLIVIAAAVYALRRRA